MPQQPRGDGSALQYANDLTKAVNLRRNQDGSFEGYSTCATAVLDGPALWRAEVRGDRVAQWRVYHDTAAMREELGIA